MRLLEGAVTAQPADVASRLNLGVALAALGRRVAAEAQWTVAWEWLERGGPFPLDRVALPLRYDRFRVEWERAAVASEPAARAAALRGVLQARIAALLAGTHGGADAVEWWSASVRARAGVDDNVGGLARALSAAGREDVAVVAYGRILAEQPFAAEARRVLIDAARARHDHAAAEALDAEGRLLAAALEEPLLPQVAAS